MTLTNCGTKTSSLFPPRPPSSQPSKPPEEPVPVPPEKSEASGAKKKTPWLSVYWACVFFCPGKLPLTPCFGGGYDCWTSKIHTIQNMVVKHAGETWWFTMLFSVKNHPSINKEKFFGKLHDPQEPLGFQPYFLEVFGGLSSTCNPKQPFVKWMELVISTHFPMQSFGFIKLKNLHFVQVAVCFRLLPVGMFFGLLSWGRKPREKTWHSLAAIWSDSLQISISTYGGIPKMVGFPRTSFHGNPKPSFLGVITHILGV